MTISRRARSVVAALAIAITAMAGLAATSASPARAELANPTKADAPARLAHGDACGPNWTSLVPDSGYAPMWFDFHGPCHQHDWCYDAKPYGRNEYGRGQCDDWFLADMAAWCSNYYGSWWQVPAREGCINVGRGYYNAVRVGGQSSFYS